MMNLKALVTLLALVIAMLAAACNSGKPQFRNTDVTGADYAKDFRLTDHTGRSVGLADYKGKVVTVFFGFTQCPDVCPTELAAMSAIMGKLGADAAKLQVLFVTIDPERDTQELLAKYVPAFHPSFIGLRGDPESTARVAKDFKVFYKKSPGKAAGSYTMDHTAGTYVFDPQGRLRLFARPAMSAESQSNAVDWLLADIKLLLAGS